jgi:hypothetical protein
MPATATPKSAAQNTVARRKAAATTPKTTTKDSNVTATKTTAKTTAKKTTTRRTPAAKKTTPATSVEVTFAINADENGTPLMPKGKGGVRFNAPTKEEALSTVYVSQEAFAKLGKPTSIVVTVAAAK